jgi:hypothetical protein
VKAAVYHGPRNVSVDEVPDAKIEKPTDALVRITATNICGSDLHMYEGRTHFQEGRVSSGSAMRSTRSSRPGSFPTTCLSTRHPKPASTSTPGKKAGRRLSCTQGKRPDLDPWVR